MERGGEEKAPKQPSGLELQQPLPLPAPLRKIIMVASIAAGIQFGWALQLSLLTPYVQLLGIPHKWASLIWLCGPVSGMIVQPLVGHYSDRCNSRFGRRCPFIAAGTVFVTIAVILIGFAADIGYIAGDSLRNGSIRPRAVAVFVVGFWILDVANNMLQGPCRALLADLSAGNQRKTRTANAFFSFFVAVGNILGYGAGSLGGLHKVFPFTMTKACGKYCANLKSCFFLSIALLVTLTTVALVTVREKPQSQAEPEGAGDMDGTEKAGEKAKRVSLLGELLGAVKDLSRPMWILLLVTCLNSIAWFPFLLYDTDWMGREVYGGKVGAGDKAEDLYNTGVRAGALGLVLNSVVMGVASLGIEQMARWLGGLKRVWGVINILLAICLALTVVITKKAESARHLASEHGSVIHYDTGAVAGALTLFAVLGIPLAIIYSIPYALTSIFCSTSDGGPGQGLSLGVLNLSIVIPQMVVSLLSGPWDNVFGGGNLPAFVVGAVAAAASGVFALTILPSPAPEVVAKVSRTGGFH